MQIPDKVIYETQSTHKLLAAFSQASMIHIKGQVDEEVFNEAYMMHTSHFAKLRYCGLYRSCCSNDE